MTKIKTQNEANEVFNNLVNTTIIVTKCSKEQAEKRINALLKSGILDSGSPNNPATQIKIDDFMFTEID